MQQTYNLYFSHYRQSRKNTITHTQKHAALILGSVQSMGWLNMMRGGYISSHGCLIRHVAITTAGLNQVRVQDHISSPQSFDRAWVTVHGLIDRSAGDSHFITLVFQWDMVYCSWVQQWVVPSTDVASSIMPLSCSANLRALPPTSSSAIVCIIKKCQPNGVHHQIVPAQ